MIDNCETRIEHKLDLLLAGQAQILLALGKPAALQALTDQLKASAAKLTAAVNANEPHSFPKETHMASDLSALTTQVQANTDAEASAVVLINGLAAQIIALKNDPVALQALADQLKASATSLSAAVLANTPAPIVPPVPPVGP